jgi:hypothetical protein
LGRANQLLERGLEIEPRDVQIGLEPVPVAALDALELGQLRLRVRELLPHRLDPLASLERRLIAVLLGLIDDLVELRSSPLQVRLHLAEVLVDALFDGTHDDSPRW